MATATGTYATLAAVKARLSGTFDSTDDTLIGTLCDQVNQYIESPQGTGRILAPITVGTGVASDNEIQSITITGSPTGGTFTLSWGAETTGPIAYNASAATVETAFEALTVVGAGNGTVSGSAGAWTVEFTGDLADVSQDLITADDALLAGGTSPAVTVAQVSTPQWQTYYFDGDGGRVLFVDLQSVHELAVASMTGGTYSVLVATDYFLRPLAQDRDPGWPATRIEISDYPAGGYWYFPHGYETVRLKAVRGWAAIPDDIVDVALTMAVRAWHARQSGQTDIVGNDETGAPIVSRYLSARDRETLRRYRVMQPIR
jgi:hypothetical protein